jgi:hypothetical protein
VGVFSLVRSRFREDDGVALIVALNVMIIAIGLSLVVAWVAVQTNTDSGVDRQRAVSVNAAEAGVDAAFISLQAAGSTANPLPCPGDLGNLSIAVPDQPTVTRMISYTDMQGNPITDCNVLRTNAQRSKVRAIITSTANPIALAGVTHKRTRVMQALVTLKPVLENGFDNAIFANANLTVNNNHTVYGNVGDDANIYSNGDVNCPTGSQQTYHGNLLAQGHIDLQGQCSVTGDAWGKNYVNIGHNQSTVGGRVISSTSYVNLANLSKISGNVFAGTTITPSCASPKCTQGLVQAAPPAQPFPQILRYDPTYFSQWTTATTATPPGLGYTLLNYTGACDNTIVDQLQTYETNHPGVRTLVTTTCPVNFVGTSGGAAKNFSLTSDLVIFADGGFTSSNQVNVQSADGTDHQLYWIAPYDRTGPACAPTSSTTWNPGDIYTDNKFAVDSQIDMMMYTPCNANIQNHAEQFGQMYAGGSATINNNFDMAFRPLPVVGINPASEPVVHYNVDITYKREVRG